ncbi:uncharacterized protein LOC124265112 isoform X2 [Haliotis rubra]|uniref:uncharacterized protein LOC124265112 isoform X2 n=1 Tax=Haliotis rubra TaxID=36100 RepID=UPI001EE5791D|nr:uncharacterized protein LOC124265112 isoform X2 [Haliotis rubra]
MNTLCTSQGAGQKSTWRGCTLWGCTWLLLLLVMVGMGTPESLVANETDDSASSIVQVLNHVIHDISDAVVQNQQVSNTVTAIMNKLKSTFDDAHLSTQRVNWFLQCISNCLSGNLDDQPTILGAKGNITVEALFTCNRFCITAGPNFNNTNHTHVGIAVGR